MLKSGTFEVKVYILFIFISYVFIILSGEALQPPYYCHSDTPCHLTLGGKSLKHYFVQVQGYYHDKLTCMTLPQTFVLCCFSLI